MRIYNVMCNVCFSCSVFQAAKTSVAWVEELKRRGIRTVSDLANKRRNPGFVALVRWLGMPDSFGHVLELFFSILDVSVRQNSAEITQ